MPCQQRGGCKTLAPPLPPLHTSQKGSPREIKMKAASWAEVALRPSQCDARHAETLHPGAKYGGSVRFTGRFVQEAVSTLQIGLYVTLRIVGGAYER
mmetsp:Transcript_9694/g.29558  ORF Transcript_9694/g.29558 Transcript_9694/m.29558 type:complete len:97 (+) Transcript_9694:104-394(+)